MKSVGRPPKKRGEIVQMGTETPETADVAEEQPEIGELPEPAAQTVPLPREKKKTVTFFERVAQIDKKDWGTRAFIYVYCLEPICNLKQGGETKYLVKLREPIQDEDPLMIDYGSGKYRLQLVHRKPAAEKSDSIDTCEIEIYNAKYPPKIPRTVWMNDPRNERWAALLPKEEPPAPQTGLGTITDAFKTFTDIRKDLREELTPPPAPALPVSTPESTMNNTLQMVQTIMAMKADNPMVEIMKAQLQQANDNAQKAIEREAALQKELRDQLRAATAPKADQSTKDGIGQIKEVASTIEQLLNIPAIQKLLPKAGDALETVTRGHRTSWLDVVREMAPGVIDYVGKLSIALASRTPGPPPAAYPGAQQIVAPAPQIAAPNGGPPPAGTTAQQPGAAPQLTVEQRIMMFLQQPVVSGALMSYFRNPATGGGDFAEWIFDGVGEGPLKDARSLGTERIMALFRSAPQWPAIASQEARLTEFVDQVLAWQPGAEPDNDEEDEDEEESGVDLTAQGV